MAIEEIMDQFQKDCTEISAECVEEGYPSHGSNYDLRRESLWKDYLDWYPELRDWESE